LRGAPFHSIISSAEAISLNEQGAKLCCISPLDFALTPNDAFGGRQLKLSWDRDRSIDD
jgi:hypothetical protein